MDSMGDRRPGDFHLSGLMIVTAVVGVEDLAGPCSQLRSPGRPRGIDIDIANW